MSLLFNFFNFKFLWKWFKEFKNGGVFVNISIGSKGKVGNFKKCFYVMLVLLDWGEI